MLPVLLEQALLEIPIAQATGPQPVFPIGGHLRRSDQAQELDGDVLFGVRLGLGGRTAVHLDGHDPLAQRLLVTAEFQGVAVTLAHLLAIGAWHHSDRFLDAGFRDNEGLAVHVVELDGDVAGDFEMLLLVLAHRHHLGVVQENVGSHEHGVSKEAVVDRTHVTVGELGHLVLVAVAALEQAHGSHRAQEPSQFGVLRRVRLLPEHATIGIEPGRQPIEGHIQGVLPTLRRIGQRRHGMVVGDEIVSLALIL